VLSSLDAPVSSSALDYPVTRRVFLPSPSAPATVRDEGDAAVAALESADLVVSNTHLSMAWTKRMMQG